jgi:hypothetical protein
MRNEGWLYEYPGCFVALRGVVFDEESSITDPVFNSPWSEQ